MEDVVRLLVTFSTTVLTPIMLLSFLFAVIFRMLIYYTVKREDWFARAFDKRVRDFLESDEVQGVLSFYVVTKRLLEKTYYELFIVRSIMKRRKPDFIMSVGDRIFLIQHGSAYLVRDTLKQIKYLKYGTRPPKFLETSKSVFKNNPCFNKVFGIIPISLFNDVLNVLPGIFIIGGIFGTFLGIMDALPKLAGMELSNVDGTKVIMDEFLSKISFAMGTSIIGIILSVVMTFVNTLFSPDGMFISTVDRFENSLDMLWDRSESNLLPKEIKDFDEHRDPIEALAEEALQSQLNKDLKENLLSNMDDSSGDDSNERDNDDAVSEKQQENDHITKEQNDDEIVDNNENVDENIDENVDENEDKKEVA